MRVATFRETLEVMAAKIVVGAVGAKMDSNDFSIGIIGLGDMGKMYARRLSAAGWR